MHKGLFAAASALTLALGFAGATVAQSPAPSSPPTASDISALPHPAHIHSGSCADLGDVVAPLGDVTLVDGSDRVGTSTTTVEVSLKDIGASPHAIMAHASAQDLGAYIACADLTGEPKKGLLVVALDEQNESGFAGVAYLRADQGKTVVDLSLTAPEPGYAAPAPTGSGEPTVTMAPMSMAPVASAPASAAAQVSITDFAFGPDTLTVSVGTTVTWTNTAATQHNVTADDGSFASDTLAQGQMFSHTFDTAGTFTYLCSIHPTMTGTITVQ